MVFILVKRWFLALNFENLNDEMRFKPRDIRLNIGKLKKKIRKLEF